MPPPGASILRREIPPPLTRRAPLGLPPRAAAASLWFWPRAGECLRALSGDVGLTNPMELIFEVIHFREGGFRANCLNADIDTDAGSLEELNQNLTAAIDRFFGDRPKPNARQVQLLFYRE